MAHGKKYSKIEATVTLKKKKQKKQYLTITVQLWQYRHMLPEKKHKLESERAYNDFVFTI